MSEFRPKQRPSDNQDINQIRFESLRKTLGAPATNPSALMRKAQAARELADGDVFAVASEEMIERVRSELEGVLLACEKFPANFEANRASGLASRVLEKLDKDELAAIPPDYQLASFLADDLAPEEARFWWSIDALSSLAYALGWADIAWGASPNTIDGQRLAQLESIADEIDASDDWLESAQTWFNENAIRREPVASGDLPADGDLPE